MDMPPGRYRVVERNRRLVVIDNRTGAPVTGADREPRSTRSGGKVQAPKPSARPSAPPPIPMAGSSTPIPGEKVLTTQPWFDDKAPRRVYIDDNRNSSALMVVGVLFFALFFAAFLFGWPVVVGAAALLGGVRKHLRAGVTRWLDGFDQV
ncbi:hypothetical protein [Sphingomonas sp.]|uniref:hypothetical protein n=1 Tax=Sphingomonas sp. TaxID=28214 RepID=UPI001B0EFD66|nr:hypothetical protein [Sphingomonas sp.]MBO9714135.1 hypothetical protein [Sphingomonas sp.]